MTCPAPTPGTGALPFAVDSKFIASGYEGDAVGLAPSPGAISMPAKMGDPTCNGMPRGGNGLGTCHTIIYTPLTPGTPIGYPTGATSMGWAGVAWQYPVNNWGTSPGYVIPAGATKVSLYAKGAVGGETVSFWAGAIAAGGTLCSDPFPSGGNPMATATLTTAWTQYTMPITGDYAAGVITAFGYSLANQNPPGAGTGDAGAADATAAEAGAADGGSGFPTVTFYVDDIEWQ